MKGYFIANNSLVVEVTFKQKRFTRNICLKGFTKFQINDRVVEFIFKKAADVSSSTLSKIDCLVVSLVDIWRVFRIAILWTPAAKYFHYYVMPRSFLLVSFLQDFDLH